MRLLALSILLLIGCSPDTAEITIGSPEAAHSRSPARAPAKSRGRHYPIPIGKWHSETTTIEFDFADIGYDGPLTDESIERLVKRMVSKESDKKPAYDLKLLFSTYNAKWIANSTPWTGVRKAKGFWYKLDNKTVVVNYYGAGHRSIPLQRPDTKDSMYSVLKLTVDRGNLLDTHSGSRWRRLE